MTKIGSTNHSCDIFSLIPTKKILYFRHFVQLISISFPDKSTKYLNLTARIQIYYLFPIDIKNAAYSSSFLYAALSIFYTITRFPYVFTISPLSALILAYRKTYGRFYTFYFHIYPA